MKYEILLNTVNKLRLSGLHHRVEASSGLRRDHYFLLGRVLDVHVVLDGPRSRLSVRLPGGTRLRGDNAVVFLDSVLAGDLSHPSASRSA